MARAATMSQRVSLAPGRVEVRLSRSGFSLPWLLLASACASQFSLDDVSSPYSDQYTLEQGRIYHTPSGREMTEEELYAYLGGFTIIYVGETHDSINDHAVQLQVLKALNERFPGKVALGLEMLRTDTQVEVDKWVAGELSEQEMIQLWSNSWGSESYPYYKEILSYAREQQITMLALNRPPNATPPGPEPAIDEDDPYYDAFIGAFLAGHKADPDTSKRFMRSQMLWDETMAETGAAFLSQPEHADKKLVVFAGNNHVRYGFGIPRRLFRRVPVNYTIVSPQVVDYPADKRDRLMDVTLPELPLPAGDILWMVGYEDLEEPPPPATR
jgi:uncharacterized iron-regulated protein